MASKDINTVIVKYIVDCISKNPLAFIPVIQAIMDPKNPDSNKIQTLVAESLVKAVISNDELKQKCLQRVLENIESCTDKEIFKIVNEQRLQLEADSQEFIKTIQEQCTVKLCQAYFSEKRKEIDNIIDDYFKTISKSIKQSMKDLQERTAKVMYDEADKNSVNLHVPKPLKDKMVEYLKFLESQA